VGWAGAFASLVRRFAHAREGGLAVMAATALPVICLMGAGALDLASVYSDHAQLQDAADAAALDAARQLSVLGATGVQGRAQGMVQAELTGMSGRVTLSVSATVASDNSVMVSVTGHRPSFFGNLFPPGGWTINAQSTAKPAGQAPLCVLQSGGSTLSITNTSQMTATGCLVQSDGNIAVDSSALLTAGVAQAVGSATGRITPTPQTGAPSIPDPFASMNIQTQGLLCSPLDLVFDLGVNILAPGIHCGNLTVQQNATAMLLPGTYYFVNSVLLLKDSSTLQGSNVTLIFDSNSYIQFQDNSVVDLTAATTGQYAGFVMATTEQNTNTFSISSNSAHRMLGTLYMPAATLAVSGTGNTVADQSAWTVVIAKGITMSGSANLVINSSYGSSNVPVPQGVGNNAGVVLVK